VLSGFGDKARSREAVVKAAEMLQDREHRLVRLFAPPFNGTADPGYIRSYLPGVRENGGQYTHGGIWLAAACLRCGETELGWRLLETMLPWGRDEETYQLEPFVLAADIYANPDMAGRGGWSWYTGAAGWFLRVAVEELLGVRMKGGKVEVRPNLPADWTGYRLSCRAGGENWSVEARKDGERMETTVRKC
jgi:cellobiose phosphorylase